MYPDLIDLISFGAAFISTGKLALDWLQKRGSIAKIRAIVADGQITPEEGAELRAMLLADSVHAVLLILESRKYGQK